MSQKNDGIFQIFDQIKVQEYRSESGIAIYAWITWKNANSRFKEEEIPERVSNLLFYHQSFTVVVILNRYIANLNSFYS